MVRPMSDNFSRRRALTWIICTVIVVLGLPAGAFAVVAGSNAFITDPGTGHRAHVNASGQVLVNAGGSTVRVASNGAPLPITGSVSIAGAPAQPFTSHCAAVDGSGLTQIGCQIINVPTGKRLAITGAWLDCWTAAAGTGGVPGYIVLRDGTGSAPSINVPLTPQGLDYSGYNEFSGAIGGPIYDVTAQYGLGFVCSSGHATSAIQVTGTVTGYLY